MNTPADIRGLTALLTVALADGRRLLDALERLPHGSVLPAMIVREFWSLHTTAARLQAIADLAQAIASTTTSDTPPMDPSAN